MSWIHPIIGGRATAYVVGFLIVVAIIGFLANVPRVFPGPVTRRERAASAGQWVGRFLTWGNLLLALASWIALVLLIAPISAPRVVVLHSRARREPVDWRLTRLAKLDGSPCSMRGAREVDLGPGVDAGLAAIDPELATTHDEADAREVARTAILDVPILSTARLDARDDASHGTPELRSQPSWLVESVEISTVMAYARTHHVEQIIVAPGRTKDLSGWKAMGAVLSARHIELCLQDEPSTGSNDAFQVERISFPRWSSTRRDLTFWALAEGRIRDETAPLHFRIALANGALLRVDGNARQDNETARLINVCIGRCAGQAPTVVAIHTATLEERATPTPQLISAVGNAGEIVTTAKIRGDELARAPVFVVETPSRIDWNALLSAKSTSYDPDLLNGELSTLQIRLPKTSPDREAPELHVVEARGRIAIAAKDSVAAAREWLAADATASANGILRIREDKLGPRTLLSWTALPVTPRDHPAPLTIAGARTTAGVQHAAIDQEPELVAPTEGIVHIISRGESTRFGVIAVDLNAALADHNPLLVLATMRSVAWVSAWIANPEFDELVAVPDDRDREQIRSVPLLDDDDYEQLRQRSSHVGDLLAIALIGAHLWLSFRLRRGIATRPDATRRRA